MGGERGDREGEVMVGGGDEEVEVEEEREGERWEREEKVLMEEAKVEGVVVVYEAVDLMCGGAGGGGGGGGQEGPARDLDTARVG